jgi:RHS repeat-associated protein
VNHIYLNGVRIAAATPAGGAMYFLTDQVESVKVVVNDQGLPVSRTEYLPYGETWFQEGESGHTPKYNSQEMDKESGFYFFNARHYDSEIGRFVTADSVVDGSTDSQGWNRYMYTRGNPVRYMDPTGHYWQLIVAIVGLVLELGESNVCLELKLKMDLKLPECFKKVFSICPWA